METTLKVASISFTTSSFLPFFFSAAKKRMAQLQPIQLEDGTVIYFEATEDTYAAPSAGAISFAPGTLRGGEESLVAKGVEQAMQKLKAMESTIRTYTTYTLNAFKEVAVANVDKVTLEFGISVSGEAGIPYITKGNVSSNLKITVQCSFPQKT
jgi:hypothetical protein